MTNFIFPPFIAKAAAVIIGSTLSMNAFAGAYVFSELGMMSISTAGAGAQAIAEGAETAYANPAGMTRLERPTLAFNIEGTISDAMYYDNGSDGVFSRGSESTQAGSALPAGALYYVHPYNDKLAFGIAIASAGGSVIEYGADFKGSLLLQDASMITVQVSPSIAYKVTDDLSVGVGLVAEYGKLEQTLGSSNLRGIGQIVGEGDSLEFGYTLSALYEINNDNRVGFTYRSENDHDLSGDISTKNFSPDASFNIVMPSIAIMSGYHQVAPKWTILWSAGWTDFSKVQTTDITLTNTTASIDREWEDTWLFSLGAHYQLTPDWRLEGGVYYETSPQDDPTKQYPDVPTGEIWKYALGATYELNAEWRMQMYYEYLDAGTPSIEYTTDVGPGGTLRGDYDIGIHYFGVLFNKTF